MSNLGNGSGQDEHLPPAPGHLPLSEDPTDTAVSAVLMPVPVLEARLARERAELLVELDTHMHHEMQRLTTAAAVKVLADTMEATSTMVDARLNELRRNQDEVLENRLQAADTQISARLAELSSKIDGVSSRQMPTPLASPDATAASFGMARQLQRKDEIIHSLRTELNAANNQGEATVPPPMDSGTYVTGRPAYADIENMDDVAQQDARASRPKVRLGPRCPGLREIVPDDPKFTSVLTYRRYRLQNTDPRQDSEVTAVTRLNIRRLEHSFRSRKFTGVKPLAVLSFLEHFKRECDMNAISEGAAMLCLPKFLDGDAFITFDANMSIGYEDVGGFATYPAAINFLLRTFASDANIEAAVQEFEALKQDSAESVHDFSRRVRKTARECGGVYTERELITRFQRGLKPELRPLLTREPHEAKLGSLHEAAGLAEKVSQSYNQFAAAIAAPRRGVLPLALRTASASDATSANMVDVEDPIALVGHSDAAASSQGRGNYSALLRQDAAAAAAVTPPHLPQQPVAADILANIQRLHDWGQRDQAKHCPGSGVATRAHVPQRNALEQYMAYICYKCFGRGHTAPKCPVGDKPTDAAGRERYEELVRLQFGALTASEQESLAKDNRLPEFLQEVVAPVEPTDDKAASEPVPTETPAENSHLK